MAKEELSFISTVKAGKQISRSSKSIIRYIEDGRLKGKKFGRYYFIEQKEWETFKKKLFVDIAS